MKAQNLNKMQQVLEGFSLPVKAVKTILKYPGLKSMALVPVLVTTVIFACLIALFIYLINLLNLPNDVAWEFWGPCGQWLSASWNYLSGFFQGFLKWVVMQPLCLVVCYYIFSMVGMVLASPFNDMLSERVEKSVNPVTGTEVVPFSSKVMALSVYDSFVIVMKQLLASIPCLPLLLIPIVGMVPLLTVTAWYTGVGFLDLAMARNGKRRKDHKHIFSENKLKILGLGFAMEFLFMIPFFNLLLRPIGVTAGTMLCCGLEWKVKDSSVSLPSSATSL